MTQEIEETHQKLFFIAKKVKSDQKNNVVTAFTKVQS